MTTKNLNIERDKVRSLAGKRITFDRNQSGQSALGLYAIEPPNQQNLAWHLQRLDLNTIATYSTDRLMDMLADLSPEVSKALWDWGRLCNPGWEIEAYRPGTDTPHPQAQALVDDFLTTLTNLYGTVDVQINRLFLNAFMRGAVLAEIVLDQGRVGVDMVAPDPWAVRYRKEKDDVRGQVWRLGQFQDGKWVNLELETIRYVPVDPLSGTPYGRPVMSSALFSALFLLAMLHDLRRVVEQQGYPRLDVSVDMDKLISMMPEDLRDSPDEAQEWINATFTEIQNVYGSLQPDDAYIHGDSITVNRPVGAVGTESLGAIDPLLRALERMITRGLKSMPLMMGSNEATSETHANRQWEIMAAGVKSIQHLVESLMGHLLRVMCEAGGIQATIKVRFAELRASEELRDAQTEAMKISNAKSKYDNGWVSQNEAAQEVTGHVADESEPRVIEGLGGLGQLLIPDQPDGSQRGRSRRSMLVHDRKTTIPTGADKPLPDAPEETLDVDELLLALEEWDRLQEEYTGLLAATPDNDAGDLWAALAGLVGASLWIYRTGSRRYVNTSTGVTLTRNQLIEIRDAYTLQVRAEARNITAAMLDGQTSLQRWLLDMQDMVRNTHTNQFMLGRGGVGMVMEADLPIVEEIITGQYGYLQNFAEDIAQGTVSDGRMLARAQMYADAGTQSYERGLGLAYGLPTLPAYPGDGQTQCLCITTPASRVLTLVDGWKPIAEVTVGEMVLTHKMRWRKVTATIIKPSQGGHNQVLIKSPNGAWVGATDTHRWFTSSGWQDSNGIVNSSDMVYTLSSTDVLAFAKGNHHDQVLCQVRYEAGKSGEDGSLHGMSFGLSMRQPQGSQGGTMPILRNEQEGARTMDESQDTQPDSQRTSGSGAGTPDHVRRSVMGDAMAGEAAGRQDVYVVLGRQAEADHLPIPVGLDQGQWANPSGLSHSPQGRESHARQFGQSANANINRASETTREAGVDTGSLQMAGPGMRVLREDVQETGAQGSEWRVLQHRLLSFSAEGQSRNEVSIFFAGPMAPDTDLYDLTVEEDHSFVVEGLFAHNSNCRCRWSITEDEDNFFCYWTLSSAEHCPGCIDNAATWNPLIIPKAQARSRAELDRVLDGVAGQNGHVH